MRRREVEGSRGIYRDVSIEAGICSPHQHFDFRRASRRLILMFPQVSEHLEKLVDKLPKTVGGPVLDHVHAVRDLFTHGKLDEARRSCDHAVKLEAARSIMQTSTALCTTIGFEPIPLADFPIITSIQISMVAGIAYVSGREVSRRAATEFIAALGANITVGLALREGSRALLKLLPGWGTAVSGAIAGAGTYALGRAAIAYFIEGISIEDARKLFRFNRHRAAPRPLLENSKHTE
jgi:uncharacterized protein (DUF697 family)